MREGARDQTFRQAAIELAIGLLIRLGLGTLVARSIASLLFDVRPSDPLVFAAIVGALIAAGVGA